jgi:hypothetical protein
MHTVQRSGAIHNRLFIHITINKALLIVVVGTVGVSSLLKEEDMKFARLGSQVIS